MMYALVKDGEVLEYRNYEPNVDQSELAPGKPRMLPVEEEVDEFDPVTEVLDPTTEVVEEQRVVLKRTKRAKNEDEIVAMQQEKDEAIEAKFKELYCGPIKFTVSGVEYDFNADTDARENIQGVLQMYREAELVGMTLPDPRPWTPMGSLSPISITRAELAGLGIAIGARKDQLFIAKKLKQLAVWETTDPVVIDAVEVDDGWEGG